MDLERAQRIVRLRCWEHCEGCGVGGLVLAVHHRQARGMGGVHSVAAQDANDPRNLLALCGRCHDETEHGETWQLTEEVGWRIPAFVQDVWGVPALLYTVNYRGQHWFRLHMDGGYTWIDPTQLPPLAQGSWRVVPESPMDRAASPLLASAKNRRIDWHGSSAA